MTKAEKKFVNYLTKLFRKQLGKMSPAKQRQVIRNTEKILARCTLEAPDRRAELQRQKVRLAQEQNRAGKG